MSAIAGAIIATNQALPIIEPWWCASRAYLRTYLDVHTTPYTKVQAQHDYAIGYLLLKDQHQPTQPDAALVIEHIQRSIKQRHDKQQEAAKQ